MCSFVAAYYSPVPMEMNDDVQSDDQKSKDKQPRRNPKKRPAADAGDQVSSSTSSELKPADGEKGHEKPTMPYVELIAMVTTSLIGRLWQV